MKTYSYEDLKNLTKEEREFLADFAKKFPENTSKSEQIVALEDLEYLKHADQGSTSFNMSLPYFRRRMLSVKYMRFLEKHKRKLKKMTRIS